MRSNEQNVGVFSPSLSPTWILIRQKQLRFLKWAIEQESNKKIVRNAK